jgi:Zn-dependent peptidase ImmA (M78 family)/transcriptional regulator with XRE-family HTH domain
MKLVNEIYLQIGEVIRSKRELSGLTQDELAARVGLTRTSITNIEKGRQRTQVHTLYAIAEVLRASPCDFLPPLETPTLPVINVRLPEGLQPKERVWVRSVLTLRENGATRKAKTASKVKLGMQPDELLEKVGIKKPPVPVEKVAQFFGAQVNSAPFKGEMSGLLFHNDDHLIIGINSLDPKERQRFAIAHELGHLNLHSDRTLHIERDFSPYLPAKLGFTTDKFESAANDFAANLLIPFLNLVEDLEGKPPDYQDKRVVDGLAERYMVSSEAMTYQLIMLERAGSP